MAQWFYVLVYIDGPFTNPKPTNRWSNQARLGDHFAIEERHLRRLEVSCEIC